MTLLFVLLLARSPCTLYTLPMGGEVRTFYDCGEGPGQFDSYPDGHTYETPPLRLHKEFNLFNQKSHRKIEDEEEDDEDGEY